MWPNNQSHCYHVTGIYERNSILSTHSHNKLHMIKYTFYSVLVCISVVNFVFRFCLFRSSWRVFWVWCWGISGVPDTPDHWGTDSGMFCKGTDRRASLPTRPVSYACPHQTRMQRQNTTGIAPILLHLICSIHLREHAVTPGSFVGRIKLDDVNCKTDILLHLLFK